MSDSVRWAASAVLAALAITLMITELVYRLVGDDYTRVRGECVVQYHRFSMVGDAEETARACP